MSKAILQNDVIDAIYDSICGYPLDEAYEILENHRVGKYIPIEWIKKFIDNVDGNFLYPEIIEFALQDMIDEWEKENGK